MEVWRQEFINLCTEKGHIDPSQWSSSDLVDLRAYIGRELSSRTIVEKEKDGSTD